MPHIISEKGNMVRKQWWAYLLMLMVYICYLLIGAAVFQKLESPFEEKRCMNAKAKVKDKKEEFGNEVKQLDFSKIRTWDLGNYYNFLY